MSGTLSVRSREARSAILRRARPGKALEVAREEEDIVVAGLFSDLLDAAASTLLKPDLSEVDALAPQPVDRRKTGCVPESPKKVTLA